MTSPHENESPFSWLKQITGPVGALVIAVFGIYYLGSFIDKMANRHFQVIDTMIEEQKEDRKQENENMKQLTINMNELTNQIEQLKECCKDSPQP